MFSKYISSETIKRNMEINKKLTSAQDPKEVLQIIQLYKRDFNEINICTALFGLTRTLTSPQSANTKQLLKQVYKSVYESLASQIVASIDQFSIKNLTLIASSFAMVGIEMDAMNKIIVSRVLDALSNNNLTKQADLNEIISLLWSFAVFSYSDQEFWKSMYMVVNSNYDKNNIKGNVLIRLKQVDLFIDNVLQYKMLKLKNCIVEDMQSEIDRFMLNRSSGHKFHWIIFDALSDISNDYRIDYLIDGYFIDCIDLKNKVCFDTDTGAHHNNIGRDILKNKTLKALGWNIILLTEQEFIGSGQSNNEIIFNKYMEAGIKPVVSCEQLNEFIRNAKTISDIKEIIRKNKGAFDQLNVMNAVTRIDKITENNKLFCNDEIRKEAFSLLVPEITNNIKYLDINKLIKLIYNLAVNHCLDKDFWEIAVERINEGSKDINSYIYEFCQIVYFVQYCVRDISIVFNEAVHQMINDNVGRDHSKKITTSVLYQKLSEIFKYLRKEYELNYYVQPFHLEFADLENKIYIKASVSLNNENYKSEMIMKKVLSAMGWRELLIEREEWPANADRKVQLVFLLKQYNHIGVFLGNKHKGINSELSQAQTADSILSIISHNSQHFDYINSVTALHRMAKLLHNKAKAERQNYFFNNKYESYKFIIDDLKKNIDSLEPVHVALVLGAIVKLELKDVLIDQLVDTLIEHTINLFENLQKVHLFNTQDLSVIVWALALLDRKDSRAERVFHYVAKRISELFDADELTDIVKQLNFQDIVYLAFAFVYIGYQNQRVYEDIIGKAYEYLNDGKFDDNPQELLSLCWSLSMLRTNFPQLNKFYDLSAVKMSGFISNGIFDNFNDLSRLLCIFAKKEIINKKFYILINEKIKELLKADNRSSEISQRQVTRIFWAIATTGVYDKELLDMLVEIIMRSFKHIDENQIFNSKELANIAWGAARMNIQNKQFVRGVAGEARQFFKNVSSDELFIRQGLANIAWAFAVFQYKDVNFWEELIGLINNYNLYNEEELTQLKQVSLFLKLVLKINKIKYRGELQAEIDECMNKIAQEKPVSSFFHQRISALITSMGIEHEDEYFIDGYFIDCADLQNKIVFEIDGSAYHDNIGKDVLKDLLLAALGWKIIHITQKEIDNNKNDEESIKMIGSKYYQLFKN